MLSGYPCRHESTTLQNAHSTSGSLNPSHMRNKALLLPVFRHAMHRSQISGVGNSGTLHEKLKFQKNHHKQTKKQKNNEHTTNKNTNKQINTHTNKQTSKRTNKQTKKIRTKNQ